MPCRVAARRLTQPGPARRQAEHSATEQSASTPGKSPQHGVDRRLNAPGSTHAADRPTDRPYSAFISMHDSDTPVGQRFRRNTEQHHQNNPQRRHAPLSSLSPTNIIISKQPDGRQSEMYRDISIHRPQRTQSLMPTPNWISDHRTASTFQDPTLTLPSPITKLYHMWVQ